MTLVSHGDCMQRRPGIVHFLFVDRGEAAGMVTLLARHGQVSLLNAVGYQDLERKTPMRTDSIFRVMSVTKPITCAGVMTLIFMCRLDAVLPVGG